MEKGYLSVQYWLQFSTELYGITQVMVLEIQYCFMYGEEEEMEQM